MDGTAEVLIAGAGVAGLEAAFALQALAGGELAVTVLAPEAEFVYPALAADEAGEPISGQRYALAEVVSDAGAERVVDAFRWLDARRQVVHTRDGREIGYGALLLAVGARRRPAFRHAVTLDPRRLDAQASRLLAEISRGEVRSVAALVPPSSVCPLPLYELSLLIAGHARAQGVPLAITLVTPERTPMAMFGTDAGTAVAQLLEAEGVNVVASANCDVPEPGRVRVRRGIDVLDADRVIALPQLFGPATPGVPKRARGGFLSVDQYGRLRGADGVYAAGDATAFAVKFGVVAAEQADAAASAIAADTGARVQPVAPEPVIRGMLVGAGRALRLTAHLVGRHGAHSKVSAVAPSRRQPKIAAHYLGPYHLGPYLYARDRAAAG